MVPARHQHECIRRESLPTLEILHPLAIQDSTTNFWAILSSEECRNSFELCRCLERVSHLHMAQKESGVAVASASTSAGLSLTRFLRRRVSSNHFGTGQIFLLTGLRTLASRRLVPASCTIPLKRASSSFKVSQRWAKGRKVWLKTISGSRAGGCPSECDHVTQCGTYKPAHHRHPSAYASPGESDREQTGRTNEQDLHSQVSMRHSLIIIWTLGGVTDTTPILSCQTIPRRSP